MDVRLQPLILKKGSSESLTSKLENHSSYMLRELVEDQLFSDTGFLGRTGPITTTLLSGLRRDVVF